MNEYIKIETNNPMLDEIIYNSKLLMSSCILKDEKQALENETITSLRNSQHYISIIESRPKFEYFDYIYEDFINIGVFPDLADSYLKDLSKVPNMIKEALLKNKIVEFKNNYVEENNYYRKLLGLPDFYDEDFIYLTDDELDMISVKIDYPDIKKTPVHKLPKDVLYILVYYKVVDVLLDKFPTKYYLKHMYNPIDIYTARKARKYQCIQLDTENIEDILVVKYRELLEINRVYIMKNMDYDSYSFMSDYYDRFIMMMIVVQSTIDLINSIPEFYISKDLFDLRTIQLFFEANGVEFFPNIPMKYQKILVKNLNKLKKIKATNANIIEICSLFGFSNVQIFKYYLCKTHKMDEDGEYITGTEEDCELKFLKVPLESIADEYMKDQSNYFNYDQVVVTDDSWNGPYDHSYVKNKIFEQEFNIVKSKYISIDTVYSLTDATFELSYFTNMLLYNNIDKSKLSLIVPIVSTIEQVNIIDCFIFLYSLMYEYMGVTDNIIQDSSGVLQIRGFNFDANIMAIGEYVLNKGYTLKELGVDGFMIPSGSILSFNQLKSIFINNKKIYDHIINEMETTDDKDIYDIYKYIFDALMITELNQSIYYISELGRMADTYSEFLEYRNPLLYSLVMEVRSDDNEESKTARIYSLINNTTNAILTTLNTENLSYIFMNLPTESAEYVKNYMYNVINFFKSNKIRILDVQTIYKLDKENKISIFDKAFIQYYYLKTLFVEVGEKIKYRSVMYKEDIINTIDKHLYFSTYDSKDDIKIKDEILSYIASFDWNDYAIVEDRFKSMISTIHKSDKIEIRELIPLIIHVLTKPENINIEEKIFLHAGLEIKDSIFVEDIMELFRNYLREYMEVINIYEEFNYNAEITKKDRISVLDIASVQKVPF